MNDPDSIHIRPYEHGDAEALFEAARESLSTVGAWLWWCTPEFTREAAKAWVDRQVMAFQSRSAFEFVICTSAGRFLGGCGLNVIDEGNARANLGYWVRSTATRRGVATTATRQLVRWAFQSTEIIRLEIVVAKDNLASLRVAEKVGSFREGTLRQRLRIRGELQDAILFSILKSDVFLI